MMVTTYKKRCLVLFLIIGALIILSGAFMPSPKTAAADEAVDEITVYSYISVAEVGPVCDGDHEYGDFIVDKEATCTANGIKSKHCIRCGYKSEVTSIPALGHTLDYVAAVSPSYTMDGNIEFWECEACGKFFADEDGTAQIKDKSSVIIAKLSDPISGGGISGTDILWITLIVVLCTTVLIEVTVIAYRAKRKAKARAKEGK